MLGSCNLTEYYRVLGTFIMTVMKYPQRNLREGRVADFDHSSKPWSIIAGVWVSWSHCTHSQQVGGGGYLSLNSLLLSIFIVCSFYP